MKNPFSFIAQLDLRKSLEGVIRRFLLPSVIVIVLSGILFYIINTETTSEWIYKSMITCIVTFFLSVGCYLHVEAIKTRKITPYISNGFPIIFAIVFYLSLSGVYEAAIETMTYIALTLSGFIAFVFVAPFLRSYFSKEGEINTHFYNYFLLISWIFLMSTIVGLALLLLGFTAISSIMALFDIRSFVDEGKLYANWAIVSMAFVSPLYALMHLPAKSDYTKSLYTENIFFSFLVRYIATPFIYIYFIILYAYSIKVLSNFSDWPKGIISWMVIGFSTFGYIIYIFSRAYESGSRLISLFRRYFAFFVAPQVGMLFYAIYLRINQYDLTMNRYFVVIFGVWLTVISLYYIVSRSKYLSLIPASLVVIMLVISVGPWSVYSVPMMRQYDRLIRNLEAAHILQNSTIVPLSNIKDISKVLSNDIYSGISYVCDFGDCKLIKDLFKKEIAEATIKDETEWKKGNPKSSDVYRGLSKWAIVSAVTESIKVQANYGYEAIDNQKYIQYNTTSQKDSPYPLDLNGGYTKLIRVYGAKDVPTNNSYPYITIDADTTIARYHRNAQDSLIIPFNITKEFLNRSIPTHLDQSDLTFTGKTNGVEIKMLLQNYAIINPSYTGSGGYEYYSINGVALTKETR